MGEMFACVAVLQFTCHVGCHTLTSEDNDPSDDDLDLFGQGQISSKKDKKK